MKFKILLFLIITAGAIKAQKPNSWAMIQSYDTSSTLNSFKFVNGERAKRVFVHHDLSVYYQTRGSKGQDSLRYRVRGGYTAIKNDSMTIESEEISVHDAYKWNNDSSYRYHKQTKTPYVRVPMKDITKVYYERSEWKKVNAGVVMLSILTAFVVAPLVSLEDGEIDLIKFRKVAYPALGVMGVSVGVGLIFAQRKFVIRTPKTSKKVWTIQPGN